MQGNGGFKVDFGALGRQTTHAEISQVMVTTQKSPSACCRHPMGVSVPSPMSQVSGDSSLIISAPALIALGTAHPLHIRGQVASSPRRTRKEANYHIRA